MGAEWTLFDALSLRVGAGIESAAVPDTTLAFDLPETFRGIVSAGVGYQILKQLRADLGLMYVIPNARQTGSAPYQPFFKGTYSVQALLAGLSIGVKI